MAKLEEQLNKQTLKGTVSVNDQNLQQALIETAVLDDLNDVAISSPTNGQILQYNSADSTWKNENNIIPNGDKGDITVTSAGTVWTIDNNAVVEDKINTGAVTETKIGTGAVTETKIADSAVTENKVANNAVTANKIANDSVTNSKLANMATATVKGRATAGTGDPEDLAIDNDLSTVSASDDTIPSAKAVKAYVDLLELKTRIRNGGLLNGFIRVTVVSNDLIVAISTSSSSQVDPTATNPVYIWIGDTLRSITSALSVTANAGTNWLAMGSAELATREVDLFPYLQWNSTTSAIDLLVARIPYANLMGDFTNSGTAEKGVFGIVNYNSGDIVVNIGRFAATLSAGAGYTWSVPTFNANNLIQRPIFETRRLLWTSQLSCSGSMTYTSTTLEINYYQIIGRQCDISLRVQGTTGGTASNTIRATMPIGANIDAEIGQLNVCRVFDGTSLAGAITDIGGSNSQFGVVKYDSSNFGLGATRYIMVTGSYFIA